MNDLADNHETHADRPAQKGRPKRATKKQQIFDAAVQLFMSQGFGRTSVDEIAEQAGVSKQTVYSHFGNKEELFRHCVVCKMDSYELTEAFLDSDAPIEQMLHAIGHHFSDMLLSPEAIAVKRTIIGESDRKLADLFYEAGPQRLVGMLTRYLTEQSQRGNVNIPDHHIAACQFLFMLQGDAYTRSLMMVSEPYEAAENERYIDNCVAMFLRAYRPPA